MAKLFDTEKQQDKCILVGVGVGQNITEESLDELGELCYTCGLEPVGRLIQNRKDVDVATYIGEGKVQELKDLVALLDAECVVFDVELSGSKVRNLEEILEVAVLDRSQVILDIFAARATSTEGKLQVELAQLEYNMPRLVGAGGKKAKLKNAIGMRGPGEKKLELDKRVIKDNILKLKKDLRKLKDDRGLRRKSSYKSNIYKVAVVGYTNSGKSTLMNTISKANVLAENKLFATLDPVSRKVWLSPEVTIMLTDTVGFVNKLPHQFVNAFESTLEEAAIADLLLHIIDCNNPDRDMQIAVVNQVLEKIGASHIPIINVYNKIDICPEDMLPKNEVLISAKNNIGIDQLKEYIINAALKR